MEAERFWSLQSGVRPQWQVAPQPPARNSDRLVFLSLLGISFPIFGPVGSGIRPSQIFWVREVWVGLVALALGLTFACLGQTLVAHPSAKASTAHRITRHAISPRRAPAAPLPRAGVAIGRWTAIRSCQGQRWKSSVARATTRSGSTPAAHATAPVASPPSGSGSQGPGTAPKSTA
jgi:hypothetical protein